MGDVNIDYTNNRAIGRSGVRDIEELYGMKQLITELTHYGNKPTTLDNILTNSDCIREYGVKHNISDHELVYVIRKKIKIQYNLINTFGRSYINYNIDEFQQLLVDYDWSGLEEVNNPNDYWEI